MLDALILITSLFFTYTPAEATNLDPCTAQTADACLDSVACDVFISDAGDHVCAMACDERITESLCAGDTACGWSQGQCSYVDDGVLGC